MTSGTAQIHKSTFSQHQDTFSALELPSSDHILNDLFLDPRDLGQANHINLVIEVTNVTHNGVVLHLFHITSHKNILITGSGHKDINFANDLFLGHDSVAFHTGL
jgi:hypothetical protein